MTGIPDTELHTELDTGHVVIDNSDHAAIHAALDSRDLSGTSPTVADYEAALRTWFRTSDAVACASGTAAIHLALLALGVTACDQVIVPATAPAMTAMPILAVGAVPVFADIAAPTTFALDLDDLARKVTDRTRAIISVPMWGYPADGPDLPATCRRWGIPLIEDAAQAHGTVIAGRYAGTRATIGTFSTHTRKLICTGEGGFCLTDDATIAGRLRELRNLGKQPDAGFGATFGLNYKLGALAAALGRSQLDRLTARLHHRRATLQTIADRMSEVPGITPFPICADSLPNGYAALFTATEGQSLAQHLTTARITSDPIRYRYRPLYRIRALARHAPATPCRNAEHLTGALLTVPCHEGVGPHDLDRIAAALGG